MVNHHLIAILVSPELIVKFDEYLPLLTMVIYSHADHLIPESLRSRVCEQEVANYPEHVNSIINL